MHAAHDGRPSLKMLQRLAMLTNSQQPSVQHDASPDATSPEGCCESQLGVPLEVEQPPVTALDTFAYWAVQESQHPPPFSPSATRKRTECALPAMVSPAERHHTTSTWQPGARF